ncbi:BREX-2 system adenine-specific DNA-methyltransferase PglX [Streptomyces sp. LN590]|uniref:BREX-2 system adenine-specific DNA-methyltransferase PglX n=1 Tax=Streptomyces sp. LN590 TaxID=3112980 RepID=UPI00370FE041
MGASSLDQRALIAGLRKQVRALETDLRERSDNVDQYRDRLRDEYDHERVAGRTAATYGTWRDEYITQAAVAWALGTVFVRYCEDNELIARPFIAGPGGRLAEAEGRQSAYLAQQHGAQDRDWLAEAFRHLARSHAVMARIFAREHNPLWELPPSPRAATGLVAFWRQRGEDGSLRFDFTDPQLDTRFLGDLYQDISDTARQAYALIQTPEFIEEFILDRTADPAIAEFGLRGFRAIDPACGSGSFLLGLFWRLLNAWRAVEPATSDEELINRTLESVHGCDVNPFAVNIARFRLLMAATQASGRPALSQVPGRVVHVAVGDALLDGRGAPGGPRRALLLDGEGDGARRGEGIGEFSRAGNHLGKNSYHVVVSEPPFIAVHDKAKIAAYRESYAVAAGVFPLSLLFVECMFQLAVRKRPGTSAGYVGQYTSSSFTKRAYGEKLIEEFLPSVGLTHVIDTSGVFVPGHGTPTLILIGRNDPTLRHAPVRSVLGVHGEPSVPENPAEGVVWRSILDQIDRPGSTSEWVSVEDEPRHRFARFPWTLTGGGAADLMDLLSGAPQRLADVLSGPVRVVADPGEQDAFELGRPWFTRHPSASGLGLDLVTGESVRDWRTEAVGEVLVPYDGDGSPLPLDLRTAWARHLWTMRQVLRAAAGPRESSQTRPWWAWRRWLPERSRGPLITFAAVATHNRFVPADDERVFSRTAPVLRLQADASEDTYVGLLGVLNSSTACFWLKQISHSKATAGATLSSPGEEWARVYSFAPKSLLKLPLPSDAPRARAQELTRLATVLDTEEPSAVCTGGRAPSRRILDAARAAHEQIRYEMVALQEELDWDVYGSYGLLSADERARLTTPPTLELPALRPGERAFEIVLARRFAEKHAKWFTRHHTTPITEIPEHWPAPYRAVVRARIDAIESRRAIAFVERPEYKRRWLTESWEAREERALRSWLLDRCEDERLWFEDKNSDRHPRPRTIGQLARELGDDAQVRSTAELYATYHLGRRKATVADVLTAILDGEQVPYAAALRYKESGLRKRAQWERVWELQRREDETGEALGIPVPPKFVSVDFRRASYWSIRGKLDIPRERFISYPGAAGADDGLLLGWSGWSDTDRVRVLLGLIAMCRQDPLPSVYQITPLLVGIQEMLPWVRQWGAPAEPDPRADPAGAFQREFDDLRTVFGLTSHDLTSWRPRKGDSGGTGRH